MGPRVFPEKVELKVMPEGQEGVNPIKKLFKEPKDRNEQCVLGLEGRKESRL